MDANAVSAMLVAAIGLSGVALQLALPRILDRWAERMERDGDLR